MTQPNQTLRYVAMAVTVFALLAISIPFVWQHNVEAEPSAAAMDLGVTPVASHEASGEAPTAGGACMADAKPANLDFQYKDLEGKDVNLSSFKGKVVLLNLWATWCGPCKAEIPGFVELQAKYKDKLAIVGLSVDDPADKAKAFAAEYKVNYPILLMDSDEKLQDAYGPVW